MPVRTGRLVLRRTLGFGALVAVLILCVYFLVARGSGDYTVTAVVDDAGQLVKGNEVQIGGVPVGTVESVELRESDHRAALKLKMDGEIAPLHEGTTATIRNPSLTSVAGRYVSLLPGPNDAEEIPDGGEIETEDTSEIVDLDQLLNSLDPRTVAALSQVVQGSTDAARGRGHQLGEAIETLNPALSRTAVTLDELVGDQRAFERLTVGASDVVDTLAARRDQLSAGTTAAASALNAIADEREAISNTLAAAPPTLRRATPALADVRGLIGDLDPAVQNARPLARGLSRLLPRLRPVSRNLRRTLPDLREIVSSPGPNDDATELLQSLPALAGQGVPLLEDLTKVGAEARPILRELRPYAPEFTSGIVAGFGGSSGGYYDANGHYARISFLGGPFSLAGVPSIEGFGSIKSGAGERCPGGATYEASDGSNPFVEPAVECDPSIGGDGP